MLVMDIMPIIYDSPTPLAVVENGRLRGILIRGRVLEALAENGQSDEAEAVEEEIEKNYAKSESNQVETKEEV